MVERKAHKKIKMTFGFIGKHRITLIALSFLLTIAAAYALDILPFERTLRSSGAIAYTDTVGCDIYDINMKPLTAINWGTLTPAQLAYQDVFLVNTGNSNATMVRKTSGWTVNSSYFKIAWNITSTIQFPPNVPMSCRIYLQVFANITSAIPRIETFAFNMTITAYGV